MFDGVTILVLALGLSWCIQRELADLTTHTKEVVPVLNACH